jgi:hypothetical protein
MTKALEEAFREAQKLPEAQQDELAVAIRAEIEAEHRSGRTRTLDPADR